MSWNYRIVEYADGQGFGIHEVYYNNFDDPVRMTKNPAAFTGDTVEEVREALLMARMCSIKRPIFKEPKEWTHD